MPEAALEETAKPSMSKVTCTKCNETFRLSSDWPQTLKIEFYPPPTDSIRSVKVTCPHCGHWEEI